MYNTSNPTCKSSSITSMPSNDFPSINKKDDRIIKTANVEPSRKLFDHTIAPTAVHSKNGK